MNILKVSDVAAALRVSQETVRLWCRTGVLPAYRPRSTKQYLINADEFDAWLKTRAVRDTVKFLNAPRTWTRTTRRSPSGSSMIEIGSQSLEKRREKDPGGGRNTCGQGNHGMIP